MSKAISRTSSNKTTNVSNNARKGGNRAKPMTPKAGYTQTRRRYGEGGSFR